MKIIVKWLLSAAALLAVAHFYSGVQVTNFGSALIAAFESNKSDLARVGGN